MQLQAIRNQIRQVREAMPPKPVRGEILFYSQRHEGDVDNATHFHYSNREERDAIRARLHALPDGPDVVRIIVHGVTAEEIAAGEATP